MKLMSMIGAVALLVAVGTGAAQAAPLGQAGAALQGQDALVEHVQYGGRYHHNRHYHPRRAYGHRHHYRHHHYRRHHGHHRAYGHHHHRR
ncbi:hypothetical protein [Chelatococcus reniformis]|uniref:hypothetical protein n=1 Tax=Chelatococcus reniformis TaxID=1494448 RepID=UPI001667A672|nr:hypothetical protein [Chelatococcus reniformis]